MPQSASGSRASTWIYLLPVLATFFWGGNFVVGRAMHAEFAPTAMSFWRWTIALIVLLPFCLKDIWLQRDLVRLHWRRLWLLGTMGMAGFHTLVYVALQYTVAVNAALVMSMTPIFIALLGLLIYRDPVSGRQGTGIVVSLAGVAVILMRGDLATLATLSFNAGDVVMICSVPLWAAYSVIIKRLPGEFRPMTVIGTTTIASVVTIFPVYLWELQTKGGFDLTPETISTVLYLGLFTSALGYIFWNKAIVELGPTRTGVFMHLVPLSGTAMAIFFLGEKLMIFHGIGAALIFGGIYLASAKSKAS